MQIGTRLAELVVGVRLADFYAAYLERSIQESRARLQQVKPE